MNARPEPAKRNVLALDFFSSCSGSGSGDGLIVKALSEIDEMVAPATVPSGGRVRSFGVRFSGFGVEEVGVRVFAPTGLDPVGGWVGVGVGELDGWEVGVGEGEGVGEGGGSAQDAFSDLLDPSLGLSFVLSVAVCQIPPPSSDLTAK